MTASFTRRLRRFAAALCASALLAAAVPASAFAAEAGGAADADEKLTIAEAQQMQPVDEVISALAQSPEYEAMTEDERREAALAALAALVEQGLVKSSSVYTDEENGMVTFEYACGVFGGVNYKTEAEMQTEAPALPSALGDDLSENGLLELSGQRYEFLGSAVIYYAYDNIVNSVRYPYYAYMQAYWTTLGLTTHMDNSVTVASLRHMNQYDLCIISAHGDYYTHSSGWLVKQVRTEPIVMLLESSSFIKDLVYGFDLLAGRVIKINGFYCVTPSFFANAYSDGSLSGTIILSETCEFLGANGVEDSSMADALLSGGAKAVFGFVNKVYTVYSRSMIWDIVNHMVIGQTLEQATAHALGVCGSDDIIWYLSKGGLNPHAYASYPIIYGDANAALPSAAYMAALAAAS